MRKEIARRAFISFLVAAFFVVSGCSNTPGGGWKKSGSDEKRGIDHFYLKSSLKPLDKGAIGVKTKLLPHKGDEAVAKATNVEKAYSVEVEGVIQCDNSSFMVLSKEYLDKQGISLKIEKDGGNMEAVVKIKPGQALYPMVQDVCKQFADSKPIQAAVSSVKKK